MSTTVSIPDKSFFPRFSFSERQWEILFFCMMLFNGVLPQVISGIFVSPLIMGMEILIMPFLFLFKSLRLQMKGMLVFAFLGYEYPLILASFFFLLMWLVTSWKQQQIRVNRPAVLILGLLIWAVLLFFMNSMVFISVSGLLFWMMTFAGPVFILLYFLQFHIQQEDAEAVLKFWIKVIRFQMLVVLLQAIVLRTVIPGDWAGGSMQDAHNLGTFLGLYILSLILPRLIEKNQPLFQNMWSLVKQIIPVFIFLVLTDSKVIDLILFVGLALFLLLILILKPFLGRCFLSVRKTFVSFLLFAGLLVIAPQGAQEYVRYVLEDPELDIYEMLGNYLFDEENSYNQKTRLFTRTFSDMRQTDPWLWWTGTGPGTFGSRASNTLAYDVMYKEDQKIPSFIPAISSPWTKRYLGDLMTKELVEIITHRSAFLAAPSSGIVSVKAELGWPGLILYLLFTYSIAISLLFMSVKRTGLIRLWACILSVFWLMYPLLMIFDNYQEKPSITFPLMILTALMYRSGIQSKTG